MVRKQKIFGVLVVLCLAAGPLLALGAEPAADADALKAAVKGFRGFLVGSLVKHDEAGAVLRVKAVTIIEGNAAKNPGILIGREAPVRFITEKDEEGKERPAAWLARVVARIEQMPAIAFGGFGGGNAVVVMDVDDGKQGGGPKGGHVKVTAHRMTMTMRGQKMVIGGRGGDADDAAEDQPPTITARVCTDDEGTLIMDRAMPGSQPGDSWDAIPTLKFADDKEQAKKKVKGKPKKEKGTTDF